MAANNLRIIYQNIADMAGTQIVASTTSNTTYTPISNTQSDLKSLVWRSAAAPSQYTVGATIIISNPNIIPINGLILAFCNLSVQATITIRGYSGSTPSISSASLTGPSTITTTGSTLVLTENAQPAAPYQGLGEWNWGTNPNSTTAYTNTRVYGRAWLSDANAQLSATCTSYVIDILDTNCPDKFIEISRIIMGSYWTPKYNTSFGLTASIKDLSTNSRTEAGDLVTFLAPYYNTLSLELKYMNKTDRSQLFKIIKSNGIRRAFYISLFPNNSDDWGKEQIYQCYGKLVTIPGISHDMYENYSSQIEIEEF